MLKYLYLATTKELQNRNARRRKKLYSVLHYIYVLRSLITTTRQLLITKYFFLIIIFYFIIKNLVKCNQNFHCGRYCLQKVCKSIFFLSLYSVKHIIVKWDLRNYKFLKFFLIPQIAAKVLLASVIMNSVDSISNCKIIIFFCRTRMLVFEENSFCCIFQIEVQ